MGPRSGNGKSLKLVLELLTGFNDSVRDCLQLGQVFLVELWVSVDGVHDKCTVLWRVRVSDSNDGLNLAQNSLSLIGVGTDKVQGTDSLSVQAEILGERLGDDHTQALRSEVSDGEGVLLEVTGGKALVGRIKEWHEASSLADLSNLFPLFL